MADREYRQNGVEDQAEFERLLAGFEPRASSVGAARLMYLAGRESASATGRGRGTWIWPLATAAMTFVAVTCAILLATTAAKSPQVVEKTVYIHEHPAPRVAVANTDGRAASDFEDPGISDAPTDAAPPREPAFQLTPRRSSYFASRRIVLAVGVDALPIVPVSRITTSRPIPSLGSFRVDMLSRLDSAGRGYDAGSGSGDAPVDETNTGSNGESLQ